MKDPTDRPDRSTGRGLSMDLLYEAPLAASPGGLRGGPLPADLAARYGPGLAIPLRADGPTLIANFVSSLDGVVSLGPEASAGGGEISGFFEPDRFVMGLLRSLADAIVVGAGTLRAAPHHEWTPRRVNRTWTDAYAAWRRDLGLASPQPTTIVVSGRGELDPRHPALSAPDVPVIVLATAEGARRLAGQAFSSSVRVVVAGPGERVESQAIVDVLAAEGVRLALVEGGPRLMGQLVDAGAIDELFLTVAPQVLGRGGAEVRPSFAEGMGFQAAGGQWGQLRSIRRAGSHVFLRYAFDPRRPSSR